MSVTDTTTDCAHSGSEAEACQEYPEFDLDWLIDDPVAPGRVTVTPADPESPTTEWLSVDVDVAVSLEEVQ